MNSHKHNSSLSLTTRSGFTLIELLVVIVVLAILMAIAIPTLLNQRQKAWDTSTRSDVAHTYKAVKSASVDSQAYNADVLTEAIASEPGLPITTAGADYPADGVKVAVLGADEVVLTSTSKSGKHFCTIARESGSNAGVTAWEDTKGALPTGCPALPAESSGPGGSTVNTTASIEGILDCSIITPDLSFQTGHFGEIYATMHAVVPTSLSSGGDTLTITDSYFDMRFTSAIWGAINPLNVDTIESGQVTNLTIGETEYGGMMSDTNIAASALNMNGAPFTAGSEFTIRVPHTGALNSYTHTNTWTKMYYSPPAQVKLRNIRFELVLRSSTNSSVNETVNVDCQQQPIQDGLYSIPIV